MMKNKEKFEAGSRWADSQKLHGSLTQRSRERIALEEPKNADFTLRKICD